MKIYFLCVCVCRINSFLTDANIGDTIMKPKNIILPFGFRLCS